MKKRLAIFLSGRGSNFINIHKNILSGKISNAEIVLVFSNNIDAEGIVYAKNNNLPTLIMDHKKYDDRKIFDRAIVDELSSYKIDLICLAGYMRIVSEVIIDSYNNNVINIHPSLLPSFKGMNAQQQAIDYGVRYAGCTVHFVDQGVDTGKIILQDVVEVNSNDDSSSLSAKILVREHILYCKAIDLFCNDKLSVVDDKVIIR